jgi:hypothetical protein
MRLRKLVVFDRLMARLVVVAPNRWVVKGAAALLFRLGARSRTTKDLDLGRQDNEEAATADFLAAQSLDLGDYFTFVIERTRKLDAMLEGVAVRYHVVVELAGRVFEEVTRAITAKNRDRFIFYLLSPSTNSVASAAPWAYWSQPRSWGIARLDAFLSVCLRFPYALEFVSHVEPLRGPQRLYGTTSRKRWNDGQGQISTALAAGPVATHSASAFLQRQFVSEPAAVATCAVLSMTAFACRALLC